MVSEVAALIGEWFEPKFPARLAVFGLVFGPIVAVHDTVFEGRCGGALRIGVSPAADNVREFGIESNHECALMVGVTQGIGRQL